MSDRNDLGRALVLYGEGRLAEAEAACREILAADPGSADALHVLGLIACTVGRFDEAALLIGEALVRAPGSALCRANLAVVRRRQGRPDVAVGLLRQALALEPGLPDRWSTLADSLLDAGNATAALAAAGYAAVLAPHDPMAHRRQALINACLWRTAAARRSFRRAFATGAGAACLLREALTLPAIPTDRKEIAHVRERFLDIMGEAERLGPGLTDPLHEIGTTAFLLAYHGEDDRPLQEAAARAYRALCPSLGAVAPHCADGPGHGRLRLGIVSEHLFGHTIGRLSLGLVAGLPRDRFHVTLCVTPRPGDPVRDRLAATADAVIELPPHDLAEARCRLAEARFDVLHYVDVGMAPLTYFLAFARLAPVQTMWLGHPDTTGLSTIDAFLSCGVMEPDDGERHYSEPLVRLPGPFGGYPHPRTTGPLKNRSAFGLPDDAHLYVCPQSLFKFHPDFDRPLIEILRRDPAGRLVLIDPHGHGPHLIARLTRQASDVAERILVLPGLGTADFIAVMASADVMLDPLHYSGGNTSLEALAYGVPIVTWPGAFMRGRHTYGFHRLMEIDELTARDHDHYADLALSIGTDPHRRVGLRRRILEANAVLYDNALPIRATADALENLVRRWSGVC